MNSIKGVKILDSKKVDMAGALSARAQEFFQPDAKIVLTSESQQSAPLWSKAVRSFATAAVACGLVAAMNVVPEATQARDAHVEASAAAQTGTQQYVSLGSLKFSDLVNIRDSIGLDEATLRDRIMPQFDMVAMTSMAPNERAQLVGGLYMAADTLEGFDRAMQQSRMAAAQRGDAPRTHAEEVQSWEKALASRSAEHKRKEFVDHLGAPKPAQTVDPAALQRTIERLQQVVLLKPEAPAERALSYDRERPRPAMGG